MKSKKKFNKKKRLTKTHKHNHKNKFKNQRGGAIVEYVDKKHLYENNIIPVPFQQVVINKNGLVQDENILQDKINLITSKAFKYLRNAQLIRNELFLQEQKK